MITQLSTLDWAIIGAFFIVSTLIGIWASRSAGKSTTEFFLSGRNMPWWLLGISMVATTFSADTPNLVTDIVRQNGVAGNWVWWAYLLTGMLTVFVYARLWRRSNVLTDIEFYELRYSGKEAAFLRGFRAFYLGVIFNVLVMATVCLAAIKIGGTLLGLTAMETLLISSIVTVIYSTLGGLKGIIFTDFFQFVLAMIGSIWAAYIIVNLPEVGGLSNMLTHPSVNDKLDLLPAFDNSETMWTILIIPLAVQWWASYYPGAEPGGGGYVAQRMLAAKDEKNAMGATLLFNVAHYALRPWPWILIALASLVFFPLEIGKTNTKGVVITQEAKSFLDKNVDTESIALLSKGIESSFSKAEQEEEKQNLQRLLNIVKVNPNDYEVKSLAYIFNKKNIDKTENKWSNPLKEEKLVHLQIANPKLEISKLGHDVAYPTMLTHLPSGLLGLVLASLIAAFMSTISTQLNLGSSYITNDMYKRFIKPDASEKQLVNVGRISTVLMMILGAWVALKLENALDVFNIIVLMGAGSGAIFILRWFWWRINAYSELVAMIVSFLVAIYLKFYYVDTEGANLLKGHEQFLWTTGITTAAWLIATFLTRPTDQDTLTRFYQLIKPAKAGWQPVINTALTNKELTESEVNTGKLPLEIGGMIVGCFTVYSALFATGYWIYGETMLALICTAIAVVGTFMIFRIWGNLND